MSSDMDREHSRMAILDLVPKTGPSVNPLVIVRLLLREANCTQQRKNGISLASPFYHKRGFGALEWRSLPKGTLGVTVTGFS